MQLSVLRPLNRAVKFQASVQSSDATALRLAAPSKLMRTTFGLWIRRKIATGVKLLQLLRQTAMSESFLIWSSAAKAVKLSQTPNQTAKPQRLPSAASAAIAVRLSQPLNRTLRLRASRISLAPQSRLSSCELYAELGSLQTSRFRSESRQRLRNREL
jgi:hypothetical protein